MALYFVGDVQGCYDELRTLLDLASFNPEQDELWLTGDLVARGPKSLDVLRFVMSLGERATTVLGNHDLHLLATAAGYAKPKKKDQVDTLLQAEDADRAMRSIASSQEIRCHLSEPGARYSGNFRRLSEWMKSTRPAPFGQSAPRLTG